MKLQKKSIAFRDHENVTGNHSLESMGQSFTYHLCTPLKISKSNIEDHTGLRNDEKNEIKTKECASFNECIPSFSNVDYYKRKNSISPKISTKIQFVPNIVNLHSHNCSTSLILCEPKRVVINLDILSTHGENMKSIIVLEVWWINFFINYIHNWVFALLTPNIILFLLRKFISFDLGLRNIFHVFRNIFPYFASRHETYLLDKINDRSVISTSESGI